MKTKLMFLAFMFPVIVMSQKTDSLEIKLHERSKNLTYPLYGKILITNYETKEVVSALTIENDTIGKFLLMFDTDNFISSTNALTFEIQIKLSFHYEQILRFVCFEMPKSIELNIEPISNEDFNEVRKTKKKRKSKSRCNH